MPLLLLYKSISAACLPISFSDFVHATNLLGRKEVLSCLASNNEVVIDRFFFRFKGLLKDLIETEIPELKKAISIPDARPEAIMG